MTASRSIAVYMLATITLTLFLLVPSPASRADDATPAVELGPLSEDFELVSTKRGGLIDANKAVIRGMLFDLRAKRDVDTSGLNVTVGMFSKNNRVVFAARLQFHVKFSLVKDESVFAYIEGIPEGTAEAVRIVFRRGAEPASPA